MRSERYKLIVCTGRRLREDGYRTAEPWRRPGPYLRLYDEVADPEETNDLSDDAAHASVKEDLLGRMYERMTTTREGLEPIPPGLSRLETIHWCLVPRDRREVPEKLLSARQRRSRQTNVGERAAYKPKAEKRCTNTTRAASG